MRFAARVLEKEHEIQFSGSNDSDSILLDGRAQNAELRPTGQDNLYSLIMNNQSYQVYIEDKSNGYVVALDDGKYFVEIEDERTRRIRGIIKTPGRQEGQVEIKAPMPGLIVKINVEAGQRVRAGDGLLIIEAMKMENEICSPVNGTVKRVLKAEQDSVDKDTLLLVLD